MVLAHPPAAAPPPTALRNRRHPQPGALTRPGDIKLECVGYVRARTAFTFASCRPYASSIECDAVSSRSLRAILTSAS